VVLTGNMLKGTRFSGNLDKWPENRRKSALNGVLTRFGPFGASATSGAKMQSMEKATKSDSREFWFLAGIGAQKCTFFLSGAAGVLAEMAEVA
jgi:hypothetical protein